jgi:geranylgeranyl diphosphate synthase type I
MPDLPDQLRFVATLVDRRVESLLGHERTRWSAVDPRLTEAIDELARMARGGKRLRAAFCYYAWKGAGGQPGEEQRAVDAGAAFELLQTFALIHDDIMDDADTRRSEQTIHVRQAQRLEAAAWSGEPRRYGEGIALLIGDLAHVYADQLIGSHSVGARELWDELRIELNLGQYLDMRAAAAGEVDRATAQRVATFKSALYTIVRPLQLGAALAADGPDPELQHRLLDFGMPVGQAFQLRDDLLGVHGDATRVGKPVGNDLREGKPTELIAIALDRADAAQRDTLARMGTPGLVESDIADLLAVLEDTGAIDEVGLRIDALMDDAHRALQQLPFADEVRETLGVLTNYVAARTR